MANRPLDEDRDDLPPSEAARARRRDHDAASGSRSGMRTGLAKQFKQVLDAQATRAREARSRLRSQGTGVETPSDALPEPPPKKRGHRGHRPVEPR